MPFTTNGVKLSSGPIPLESTTDLTAPTPSAAFTLAQSTGQRVEISSDLSAGETTFAMPDGGEAILSHAAPIRVAQAGGGWSTLSTSLAPITDGLTSTTQTPDAVDFGGGSSTTLARATVGGQSVGVDWSSALPTPTVKGSTATYSSVASGTDLTMTALPDGYELSLILNSQPAAAVSYRVPLHLPSGWTAATNGAGGVDLSNANGVVKQHISATAMHDASAASSVASADALSVASSLDTSGSSPVLVLTPSWSYLSASSTVYPVTIDPTIEGDGGDTFTYEANPTHPYSGAANLDVGELAATGAHVTRSFIDFPITGFHSKNIASSFLGMYMLDSDCIDEDVNIYKASTLPLSSLTWNYLPQPTITLEDSTHFYGGENSSTGVDCPANGGEEGGQHSYPATSTNLGQAFAADSDSEGYVEIRGANEADDTDYFQAASYNNTTGVPAPYIDAYVYQLAPSSLSSKYTSTLTPQLSASVPASSDSDVTAKFYVGTTVGGTDIVNGGGSTDVPQNTTQTVTDTMPNNTLRPGGTYDYYVESCNPWGACVDSANQTFTVDPNLAAGNQSYYGYDSTQLDDALAMKVNRASGNLLLQDTDMTLPGATNNLSLGVSYNSLRLGTNSSSAGESDLSPGWSYNTGDGYNLSVGTGSIKIQTPNGGVLEYVCSVSACTGAMTTFTKPSGADASLVWHSSGNPYTLKYDGSGEKVDFNSSGQVADSQNREGGGFTFHYPTGSSVPDYVTSDVGSFQINFTYTGTPKQLTEISESNGGLSRAVHYNYDSAGRLYQIENADSQDTTFGYTSSSSDLIDSITDPNNVATDITYRTPGMGYLSGIISDQVASTERDAGTGGLHATTGYTYVSDNEIDVTQPSASSPVDKYTSNTNDLITTTVDAYSKSTTQSYSDDFKPKETDEPDTSSFVNSYNGCGADGLGNGGENACSSTDEDGTTTTMSAYGTSGQANQYEPGQVDDSFDKQKLDYDTNGNFSGTEEVPSGGGSGGAAAQTVTESSTGQLKSSIEPNVVPSETSGSGVVANKCGNAGTNEATTTKCVSTQLNGSHQINELDPVTVTTGSQQAKVTYTYDGFGRLATETTYRTSPTSGVTQTYTYDNQDRILRIAYSDSTPTIDFSFDHDGNQTVENDGVNETSTYYNTLGDTTAKIKSTSATSPLTPGTLLPAADTCPVATATAECHTYDKVSNLLSAEDAGGITTYDYNKANLLDAMREPGSVGNTTGSGPLIMFGYNAKHERIDTWDGASGTGASFTPGYSTTSGMTYQIVAPVGYTLHIGETLTSAGRANVIKATTGGGTVVENLNYNYEYATGDPCSYGGSVSTTKKFPLRQSVTDSVASQTTTYCYDDRERLISSDTTNGGSNYSYTYDGGSSTGNGNITAGAPDADSAYNDSNEGDDWTYDGDGNLTNGSSLTGSYNTHDQSTSLTASSTTVTSTYDGTDQTQRATGNGYTYQNGTSGITGQIDGSGNGDYFERSSDGFLVSERTVTTGTQAHEYYYYFDATGSVLGMVDASTGSQAATFSYDPYGKDAGTTGTAASGNPFRYAGAYRDSNGLYLIGARYYNPRTGSFLSQDSDGHSGDIAQGDRYTYAGDDPVNYTDPGGNGLLGGILDSASVVVGVVSTFIPIPGADIVGGLVSAGLGAAGEAANGCSGGAIATAAGVGLASAVGGGAADALKLGQNISRGAGIAGLGAGIGAAAADGC